MPNRLLPALAMLCLMAVPGEAAPRSLVDAVIHVESGGNARAKGRAGEIGLMQIMPRTARGLGYRGTREGLFVRSVNIKYGSLYLDRALKIAGGNLCVAASLYQTGLGGRKRCSQYGLKVVRAMR